MKLDETPIGRGLNAAFNEREIRLRSSLGQVLWINEEALRGLIRYAVDLGWKLPLLMKEDDDGDRGSRLVLDSQRHGEESERKSGTVRSRK